MDGYRVVGEAGDKANSRIEAPVALAVAATALVLGFSAARTATAAGGFALAGVALALAAIAARPGRLTAPDRALLAPFAAALALTVWAALSLGWAVDPGAGFADVVTFATYAGVLLVVGLLARPGTAGSWLAGLSLAAVIVAIAALGARTFGYGNEAEIASELRLATDRFSYPLGYWNALGYMLAAGLPGLALLVGRGGRVAALAAGASVPVILVLVLTSSRGSLLAAALAFGLMLWLAPARARGRLLWAGIVAAPAWAAVVGLALLRRPELDPFGGFSAWALAVDLVALLLAVAVAFGVAWTEGLPSPRLRARGRRAIAASALAVVVAVLVAGPSALIGEFRTTADDRGSAAAALVSGSGRSEFWRTALQAFGDEPARGIGAGSYASYWTANGEIPAAIQNAHSSELEVLAELGLPGLAALLVLLGAPIAVGRSRLRAGIDRLGAAAALAVYATGVVAVTIDWSWELLAAGLPMMVAVGLLCGRALKGPEGRAAGTPVGRVGFRLALAVAAVAALWAGGLQGVVGHQLERSDEALASGDLPTAAAAARRASALQPWAMEPHLRIAEIEQIAGNLRAARRRAEAAARRAPEDFRPWVLMADLSGLLGAEDASLAYFTRAVELGFARTAGDVPAG